MKPRSKCFIHSRSLSQTKCLYFCINFHSNDFLVSLKSLLSLDGAFPCWHLARQNKGIAHPLIQTLTPKTSKKPRPWRPRCQTSGLRAVLQKPMGDITLGLHLGSKPSAQCSPGTPCFKPRLPSESCRVGAELWRQPREQDDPSRLMCSGASVGDLTRMKAYFTAFRESQNSFFSPTFFTTLRYLLCYSFTWLQINLLDIRDSSGKPFQWLAFMNPHQSRKPFPLILQRHCLWFHYEQQGWRLFFCFFSRDSTHDALRAVPLLPGELKCHSPVPTNKEFYEETLSHWHPTLQKTSRVWKNGKTVNLTRAPSSGDVDQKRIRSLRRHSIMYTKSKRVQRQDKTIF